MKRLALLTFLVPAIAFAEGHRGWLTGLGLGISGAGVVAMALGGYHAAQGDAARRGIAAYYANGAAPTVGEAPAVRWLHERSNAMGTTGLGLLISGAIAVALGVGLVFLNGWVSVSVSPERTTVVLSGTF